MKKKGGNVVSEGAFSKVPSYHQCWSGETLTDNRARRLAQYRTQLLRLQTPAERRFGRFMSGFTIATNHKKSAHPLWFTPQKIFNVAETVTFFVDFYFRDVRLAVELDGQQHHYGVIKEQDEWRERLLYEHDIGLLRFDNSLILIDMSVVARTIIQWMTIHIHSKGQRHRLESHLRRVRNTRRRFYDMVYPNEGCKSETERIPQGMVV